MPRSCAAHSHHHDVLAVRRDAAGLQRRWLDADLLASPDQGDRVGELVAHEDGLACGGSVVRLASYPGARDHSAAGKRDLEQLASLLGGDKDGTGRARELQVPGSRGQPYQHPHTPRRRADHGKEVVI
jgi:hypothetical protein